MPFKNFLRTAPSPFNSLQIEQFLSSLCSNRRRHPSTSSMSLREYCPYQRKEEVRRHMSACDSANSPIQTSHLALHSCHFKLDHSGDKNQSQTIACISEVQAHHHVLVRSDNMAVVSLINHQGGLRFLPLYRLARCFLFWAGAENTGANMQSRSGPLRGKWRLHYRMVEEIVWPSGKLPVALLKTERHPIPELAV